MSTHIRYELRQRSTNYIHALCMRSCILVIGQGSPSANFIYSTKTKIGIHIYLTYNGKSLSIILYCVQLNVVRKSTKEYPKYAYVNLWFSGDDIPVHLSVTWYYLYPCL